MYVLPIQFSMTLHAYLLIRADGSSSVSDSILLYTQHNTVLRFLQDPHRLVMRHVNHWLPIHLREGETKSYRRSKVNTHTLLLLEQKNAKKEMHLLLGFVEGMESDYTIMIVMLLLTQWCNHRGHLTTVAEFGHQNANVPMWLIWWAPEFA